MTEPQPSLLSGRTAWARHRETQLRQFLRTETGSAAVLLAATVAALIWANASITSYDSFWATELSVRTGSTGLGMDLHDWVNSGLMTFFFLVMGLEARREFDMGELRERRRLALPVLAGLGGMIVPIGIYLAINAGGPGAQGWGTAMSTDTAFALGMLVLVGRGLPDRVRTYVLTVSVVDDLAALIVIAVVYSHGVRLTALLIGVAILAAAALLRIARVRFGAAYFLLGLGAWVAFFKSGVDPVVVGLLIGLFAYASPPARSDLERASDLFRLFREQPTPELARSATEGVRTALSPNERLQALFHPWSSYVIVPLFALANAGVVIRPAVLSHAFTAPVTLGILIGCVVGRPIGTAGTAWLLSKVSRGRIEPPIGWAAVLGAGTIAGIGFTVSLLIAALAFHGALLAEAKIGILSAALCASALTWLVFRVTRLLPKRLKIRALLGTAELVTDLAVPVDPGRDHVRGPMKAPVTLVEYGDFECPYCGLAEPVVRELLADTGDLRFVFRHLPLTDVHQHAQLAAEGAEAADRQGAFWDMHDMLMEHQGALTKRDLLRYAAELGLDQALFAADLRDHVGAAHVAEDVDSADLSGVSGTPTFFVNGKRHYGAYDIGALSEAVRAARARALIAT
ncbi:MAG TPA: Na+/H+ antiporter NhaA [Streptosporangiaceae bacterium]|nr:Na+/H+ antiporter NhaA [Streptosporangiaceae bacterium]